MFGISLDQIETHTLRKFHVGRAKGGLVICLKSLLRFLQGVDGEKERKTAITGIKGPVSAEVNKRGP